ncbi:uncharacterized protein FOMMEDRAFT_165160 [Fomitiporia mediterranea MF3/22]|uniref:uncharacterized protein n=1 Tax=Fomitiporia mediterranea (strain MF3/22) TaxID=694068 RepID=UPI0004409515|nr:uncharacterized protein FOMMEDRAFT_165160 [Fomitiporia mediterranea MF3/22]EJD06316.1 hypothetical protein FOMMEDRAFT_165160 [Fomitiporia mediterranea MF3/22]
MVGRHSYVPHRRALYALLWMISVAELGFTAYRIHYTRKNFGTHESIIVELLVVSILTIIWAPLTLIFHRSAPNSTGSTSTSRSGGLGFLHGETTGNFIIWVLWLVGAAIATHNWPTRAIAGPGKQGRILITIVALAWVAFSLLTLAKIGAMMEYSARNAIGGGAGFSNGYGREKAGPGNVGANAGRATPATTV